MINNIRFGYKEDTKGLCSISFELYNDNTIVNEPREIIIYGDFSDEINRVINHEYIHDWLLDEFGFEISNKYDDLLEYLYSENKTMWNHL